MDKPVGLDRYVIKDEPVRLDDKQHSKVDSQTKAKDESKGTRDFGEGTSDCVNLYQAETKDISNKSDINLQATRIDSGCKEPVITNKKENPGKNSNTKEEKENNQDIQDQGG